MSKEVRSISKIVSHFISTLASSFGTVFLIVYRSHRFLAKYERPLWEVTNTILLLATTLACIYQTILYCGRGDLLERNQTISAKVLEFKWSSDGPSELTYSFDYNGVVVTSSKSLSNSTSNIKVGDEISVLVYPSDPSINDIATKNEIRTGQSTDHSSGTVTAVVVISITFLFAKLVRNLEKYFMPKT